MKFILVLVSSLILLTDLPGQTKLKLLVVSGGHRYDTIAFHDLFRGFNGMKIDTALQPFANQLIASNKAAKYDVILFYDSWKNIHEKEKKAYQKLVRKGTGLVFMHHALVSYQDWPEFTTIIGGKYKKPKFKGDTENLSDFKHDILLPVKCNPTHPVTAGIPDFELLDEAYINIDIIPGVIPLLTTSHPVCDEHIAWVHKVKKSRIVYLMPGHSRPAFENPFYKKIIERSILWAAHKISD